MQWFNWWFHQHHVMLTLAPVASHNQESHVTPHFNCLTLRNAVVPLMILLALCDAGGNGVTWPKEIYCISFQLCCWCWYQWCCMTQKIYVSLYFDLRSAMVSLTMLFASHGPDASANGIKWPRNSCCISLQSSWPKNIMVPVMML